MERQNENSVLDNNYTYETIAVVNVILLSFFVRRTSLQWLPFATQNTRQKPNQQKMPIVTVDTFHLACCTKESINSF